MAKFQSKGKSKGGASKIDKKKPSGVSKPGGNKKNKILQKKAKYSSKKFKGGKPKPKEEVKKEEVKPNELKRKLPVTAKKPPTDEKTETPKKTKPDHRDETVKDLMAIYEKLRRKNTSKDDKHKLIDDVLQRSQDKKEQLVYKHDTVRVLELSVKYGDVKQREKLFDLFKENTIQLVTTEGYSKFLIKKFMEYGTKAQKAKIIASFYGKTRNLMKQKVAADILEELYSKYANSVQRISLTEEFYGPEYAVYKVSTGESFEHMIANEPEKKEAVLDFMKTQFVTLCQKDLITHSITHKALLDFFKHANTEQKMEVHEVLKEQVVNILHTKEGARLAMNCLWLGTKKDRKAILKSFKTFVGKICKEEFGHLVMLCLFDVFDDTVLVKKAIFPEIIADLEEMIANQYGRKVILYLLKPRSPSYFLPAIVQILQQGDDNVYSKKPQDVRQEELRSSMLPELLKAMMSHLDDIMRNKSVAIVLLAALECAPDSAELTDIFEKITSMVSKPLTTEDDENEEEEEEKENKGKEEEKNIEEKEEENEEEEKPAEEENEKPTEVEALETKKEKVEHLVCDACGHWVVKNIVQRDKKRKEDGKETMFSQILCDSIPGSMFAEWATFNRGAFVLVALVECGIDPVKNKVVENLNLPASVAEDAGPGVKLLHKLLTS